MINEVPVSATYSTLSALDRSRVLVPVKPESVVIHRDEECTIVKVESQDQLRNLVASRIGNDCYNVCVENWSGKSGELKSGPCVFFTTTGTWVEQWIEMALASMQV